MSTVEEIRSDNLEAFLALRSKLAAALTVALAGSADPEVLAEAVMGIGETEWQYTLLPEPTSYDFKLTISVHGLDQDEDPRAAS